ncbi:MAG: response regulator [Gammaproteobacteria bacterium]|jgi:DNA-binding LytR/AlgR family response regulator|nr:response regulator [Gammaproteobacteria bacterium]
MPTALLVDDEPNLRRHLAEQLSRVWPALEIAGTAGNGREALALAAELDPDVVFLDIRMPGQSGLEVAAALPADMRVVFVTAYDDYAVQAFETAAVDYLLKPVSEARLAATVERLQADAPASDTVARLLEQLREHGAPSHLQWIRAGRGDGVTLVPVSSVVYFQAEHKYTSVRTASAEHVIRTPITELERQLDPDRFWRIHRGTIVAAEQIVEARRDLRGRLHLTLRSRPETLRVSQRYAHRFRQM